MAFGHWDAPPAGGAPLTFTLEVVLRNRLGLFLVVAYFAHAIASVAFAASIEDPKGQAVWLAAPLILTPSWLFELLPSVVGPKSYATWYLQLLVRYPLGIAFTSALLYFVGWLLQRIWLFSLLWSAVVGLIIGLFFGSLWFVATANHPAFHSIGWFALALVGALASASLRSRCPTSNLSFHRTCAKSRAGR